MKLDEVLAVTISGVRLGEADAVRGLIDGCGLPVADITDDMLRDFLVARRGSRLIGVVGLQFCGPDVLLRSLAVAEDHRGKQTAQKLAAAAEKYARSRQAAALYLLTQTADGFFSTRGYAPVDRRRVPAAVRETAEFSRFCPASAVCMVKAIAGG